MVISQAALDQVLDHILPRIKQHQSTKTLSRHPFVIGLTGLQGSGKSTWAKAITDSLSEPQRGFKVVNVSLDDFYHNHENLVRVRQEHPDNPLLKTRGQPGTHDEELAAEFFASLACGGDGADGGDDDMVRVPAFDKSRFNGEGDRVPREEWHQIPKRPPIDVVVFEGWCVGFQALPNSAVQSKWQRSRDHPDTPFTPSQTPYPTETLAELSLQNLLDINASLAKYNAAFMGPEHFDFFVHLDTDDLQNVYRWRIDQEHALLRQRGEGMTDEGVVSFVKGYMPGYELYLGRLRGENFPEKRGAHLRVTLGRERNVVSVETVN